MPKAHKTKEEKSAYDQATVKRLYKRVPVYIPRDWCEDLDRVKAARGDSMNAYILRALAAQIARDQQEQQENAQENKD